jgi:hypothetical protein
MDENVILEINNILKNCSTYQLTDGEITRLLANNPIPVVETCAYYGYSQDVMEWRSEYANMKRPISLLEEYSVNAGCSLDATTTVVPSVDIPVFAVGL